MLVLTIESWRLHSITLKKGTPLEVTMVYIVGLCDKKLTVFRLRGYDPIRKLLYEIPQVRYRLGVPDDGYEQRFPNARENLLLSLEKRMVNKNAEKTQRIQEGKSWYNPLHALAALWSCIGSQNSKRRPEEKDVLGQNEDRSRGLGSCNSSQQDVYERSFRLH